MTEHIAERAGRVRASAAEGTGAPPLRSGTFDPQKLVDRAVTDELLRLAWRYGYDRVHDAVTSWLETSP